MKKLEQKEIELVQSYLTQEEAKIIIPEYIENFNSNFRKENCLSDHDKEEKYTNPANCVNDGFSWACSPQGHDYWQRICGILRERYYDGV